MFHSRLYLAALVCSAVVISGCGKPKSNDVEPPVVAKNATPTKPLPPAVPKAAPTAAASPSLINPSVQPLPPLPKLPTVGSFPKVSPPTITPTPTPVVAPMPTPAPPPTTVKTGPDKTPDPPMPEAKLDPSKYDPSNPENYPDSYLGRPLSEYIADISNPDPAIREFALRTLPKFGPNAKAPATHLVLLHMAKEKERDPSVRAAAFEAVGAFALFNKEPGLDSERDTSEAIRLLCKAVDEQRGTRLHAIQTLAKFGYRAESAVTYITSRELTETEPAYQTRQAVAATLGYIGANKDKVPSTKALHSLADTLIRDKSAAVRLAAYQSLVLLGPPLLPGSKVVPDKELPIDTKAMALLAKPIKNRLLPFKKEFVGSKETDSPTGLMERDKQVEIFTRFTLMRFDRKEVNDENLKGISKYVHEGVDSGPKMQALYALGMMGELAGSQLDNMVPALEDVDPQVVVMGVSALMGLGKAAGPALPFLKKLKSRGSKKGEKKPTDYPIEYYSAMADQAIKAIVKKLPADEIPEEFRKIAEEKEPEPKKAEDKKK